MPVNLELEGNIFVQQLLNQNLMSFDYALAQVKYLGRILGQGREVREGYYAWPNLMVDKGFYTVLTQELIDGLIRGLDERGLLGLKGIEICAGRGMLSYFLNKFGMEVLPIDNGQESRTQGNPDVKRLSHKQALRIYNPKLVIGNWIPHHPEIGHDILEYPSVDYFLDIRESEVGNSWLTSDYQNPNFEMEEWTNTSKYTIGVSDYFYFDKFDNKDKFSQHTQVYFWKRKNTQNTVK